MSKRKPKPITFDEVMSKLDELRIASRTEKRFTPDQDKVILAARTGQKVVSYDRLAELWEESGWGHIAHSTLRDRYLFLTKDK